MRRLTGDPVLSELIVQDYRRAGLDAKTRAMLDYAIKITRTPVDCDEADIEKLRSLGFSLDDVYDIITTASPRPPGTSPTAPTTGYFARRSILAYPAGGIRFEFSSNGRELRGW